MLITIKPHSSFSSIFAEKEYSIDVNVYADLIYYLNSMHPRFINYVRQQYNNKSEESYVFLDKKLNIINLDEMIMRKAKHNDVVYIVPAIVGGGGKRGGILAAIAMVAFAFVALPALAGAGLFGSAASAAAAGASATGMGAVSTVSAIVQSSTLLSNLVLNIGLAMLTSLFSTKPKEETTRQNDMFGSLTNSTASGTPIGLNYGMVRVAGQLISGYIDTTPHGKTVKVDVFGEVVSSTDVNYNTPESTQQEKVNNLLEGFNQYV